MSVYFCGANVYLSIFGSLNYLVVVTRLDLSFAVGFLSRFSNSPTERHWVAIQHALGYIKALSQGSVTNLFVSPILWASKHQVSATQLRQNQIK
ncbi:gag-pol polyprotein [Puccinia sorghi]|uniref:Gag-pol polyprotein n=1 Tax=Puccinia sorghi TaxID=27349 RepID=A0A0L6UV59_9BASI|nr:gag-pol polyprotein [Puccinia sorghi]